MNQIEQTSGEKERNRVERRMAEFLMNRSVHKKPMYKGKSEGKANAAMYFLSVNFHLQSLFGRTAYVICCFVVRF